MTQRLGTERPDKPVQRQFTGTDPSGHRALVMRTATHDHAQYSDLTHPKCHGWWRFPRGHFKEVK
jgi:hypothetical protein